MSKLDLSKEKIVEVLESKSPKSLTEVYRHLGGSGKLSGSAAKKMRELVSGIDNWLDNNKAKASGERQAKDGGEPQEKKPTLPTSRKSRGGKKNASKNHKYPRHPKNVFREGSGYGLLLDIIADAGTRGIGKEDLLKAYCKATGKDVVHAKFDLSVINSGEAGRNRHRSMKDNVTIIREGDNYQVRFD